MRQLDLTLDSAAADVALDEALLESCDAGELSIEVLRLWEPRQIAVVVGRSSIVEQEVNTAYCDAHSIPIIRRCSGGAAVVCGPGCLMYSVVLDTYTHPQLAMIDAAHKFVLSKMIAALTRAGQTAVRCGISDIAIDDRKVSGNSLRRHKRWLLYHGTLLYQMSPDLLQRCLNSAPRQPEYRRRRNHRDFVGNIHATATQLRRAILTEWDAQERQLVWPQGRMERLLKSRYGVDAWNFQR